MHQKGIVYLIGAGPGDPGLITVMGLECLRQADVVIYDRLVNPRLLQEVGTGAELIYVGKAPGRHTLSQEEINSLLIDKAHRGKVVARLKGGDPFVFGRGGEEAEVLAEAGITFQVVPGVTSAIAAPAYAGIPVTHRGVASSFAVITGHRREDKRTEAEDKKSEDQDIRSSDSLPPIPEADTLIFLMGVGNLPHIVQKLAKQGCSLDTPVAVIRWGTTAQQETVIGALADIVAKVEAAGLKPPAVTIVGDVVRLREKLRWFETKALFGQRVLVTRTREQASVLSEKLRTLGAEPIEFPTIKVAPPEDWGPIDAAIARLGDYDWVVFTSANGVRFFFQRLAVQKNDARALAGVRLGAIGPATAAELGRHGLLADYVPGQYVAEAIVVGLGDVAGQRILLPRADIARESLANGLRQAGAQVDEATAYRTTRPQVQGHSEITPTAEDIRRMLLAGEIDVVTFTSSSTVRNLVAILGDAETLRKATVACIGPITAQTAREAGLRVDVVAEEYTIEGLVEALTQSLAHRRPG